VIRKAFIAVGLILGAAIVLSGQANISSPQTVLLGAGSAVVGKVGIDQTTPGTTNAFEVIPDTAAAVAFSNSAKATLTTAVNVKASAGNVYGVFALNGAASTCWIQFLNSASTGTLGTAVIFSVPLPASTTQPVWVSPAPQALANFSTGIAVGISTTATGASACGTGGNITVFYK